MAGSLLGGWRSHHVTDSLGSLDDWLGNGLAALNDRLSGSLGALNNVGLNMASSHGSRVKAAMSRGSPYRLTLTSTTSH